MCHAAALLPIHWGACNPMYSGGTTSGSKAAAAEECTRLTVSPSSFTIGAWGLHDTASWCVQCQLSAAAIPATYFTSAVHGSNSSCTELACIDGWVLSLTDTQQ